MRNMLSFSVGVRRSSYRAQQQTDTSCFQTNIQSYIRTNAKSNLIQAKTMRPSLSFIHYFFGFRLFCCCLIRLFSIRHTIIVEQTQTDTVVARESAFRVTLPHT